MAKYLVAAVIALAICATSARADEPSLNDLPGILQKLRGCTQTKTLFGREDTTCQISKSDLWASVSSDGELTLFRSRNYGDIIYARGNSVSAVLRDFATKINADRDAGKMMLDAMAPYLPSQ